MKNKFFPVCVLMLLVVALCGCSNQQDSSKMNENSEMNITGDVTSEEEAEVTEEILAEGMDLSSYAQIPDNAIQEFWSWSEGRARVGYEPDGYSYWKVTKELAEEYITFLTEEMGMVLQETGKNSYGVSYGFTHSSIEAEGTIENKRLKNKYPIVLSYGGTENAKFYVNKDVFTVCDMGYRRSGEKEEVKVYGESAGAALIKTSDGIYKTDDGRLQTKLNEAMVIRNGETTVTQASHQIRDTKESILVEYYYRDEGFYLETPKYYSLTGDIYRIDELVQSDYPTFERDEMEYEEYGGKLTFLMSHNGVWSGPTHWENEYKQLTVRVMYYEKDVEAVYYVYAKFADEEPSEVEALVAVDLSEKEEKQGQATSGEVVFDEIVQLKDGDTLLVGQTGEISCDMRKSSSAYHVYNWSIIDGKGLVTMEEVNDSCKITAIESGTVKVKCSYSYTVDSTNVLTGNPEKDSKIDTEIYEIMIK